MDNGDWHFDKTHTLKISRLDLLIGIIWEEGKRGRREEGRGNGSGNGNGKSYTFDTYPTLYIQCTCTH